MKASMHEAKTGLSRLVERAVAGEEIILTKGKARIPVARIVPILAADTSIQKGRPIGLFASEMGDGPGFKEPMPEEELALWEAPIVSTWTSNSPEVGESE